MEQTFGERLKRCRKNNGLTQQELAERIGVSDKTVSRWESDGGYPDVATLVPLARALGVTVDDLLDDQRPIRTLNTADWQNLLSFGFALGGGVLFFLLDLFMPTFLCYLAYLGCLAYGAYLQKYYAYRSGWFFFGECVMNLSVNFTAALKLLAAALAAAGTAGINQALWPSGDVITMLSQSGAIPNLVWRVLRHQGLSALILVLAALALTAVTQYLVWQKVFDGKAPAKKKGQAPERGLTLRFGKPAPRRAVVALVPVLAGLFWLPALWKWLAAEHPQLVTHGNIDAIFGIWLVILAVLAALPLLKKGYRRWILPAWVMTALCWIMTGLRVYPMMWSKQSNRFFPYQAGAMDTGRYTALGWGSWGTVVAAAVLALVWLFLSCLYLKQAETPAETEAPEETETPEEIPETPSEE